MDANKKGEKGCQIKFRVSMGMPIVEVLEKGRESISASLVEKALDCFKPEVKSVKSPHHLVNL